MTPYLLPFSNGVLRTIIHPFKSFVSASSFNDDACAHPHHLFYLQALHTFGDYSGIEPYKVRCRNNMSYHCNPIFLLWKYPLFLPKASLRDIPHTGSCVILHLRYLLSILLISLSLSSINFLKIKFNLISFSSFPQPFCRGVSHRICVHHYFSNVSYKKFCDSFSCKDCRML